MENILLHLVAAFLKPYTDSTNDTLRHLLTSPIQAAAAVAAARDNAAMADLLLAAAASGNAVAASKKKKKYLHYNIMNEQIARPGYSAESQFACRRCGKRYRWKSTMRRHEQVECGGKEPMYQCPECSYRAKQKGNLNVHMKKHHGTTVQMMLLQQPKNEILQLQHQQLQPKIEILQQQHQPKIEILQQQHQPKNESV